MIPQTIQMSQFALSAQYEDIPEGTADQLKRHLLDSIGSFIFAQDQMPIIKLRNAFVDLQEKIKIFRFGIFLSRNSLDILLH